MCNPEERHCSDWLQEVPGSELNSCKRCGRTLCNFVAAAFPSAEHFRSARAHPEDTGLWHVFYDGNGWTESPVKAHNHPMENRRMEEEVLPVTGTRESVLEHYSHHRRWP